MNTTTVIDNSGNTWHLADMSGLTDDTTMDDIKAYEKIQGHKTLYGEDPPSHVVTKIKNNKKVVIMKIERFGYDIGFLPPRRNRRANRIDYVMQDKQQNKYRKMHHNRTR